MQLLQSNKFLNGSSQFNTFVPTNCKNLPINKIGFRSAMGLDMGSFFPLKIQSEMLKWKGTPREKAIEATIWFLDSTLNTPLTQLKYFIPNQRVKIQINRDIFNDLDRIEKIINERFSDRTLSSILDASDQSILTKLGKDVHVFEVPKRSKPIPSSLESMINHEGPIKLRTLLRITGAFCPNDQYSVKLCASVVQIHWQRENQLPKRRAIKRPAEKDTDESPSKKKDRVTHYNEETFNTIVKNFIEDWIETKQHELGMRWVRVDDYIDMEMNEKDDVDLSMTDAYVQEMVDITQSIFKDTDLEKFLVMSEGFHDYAQDLHNQEYQTQPWDDTVMRLNQIKLDYHRDVLEFINRVLKGLKLHHCLDKSSTKFQKLKKLVEDQLKPLSEDDVNYVGITQSKRLELVSNCLHHWLENSLSKFPLSDSLDVIKEVKGPKEWSSMVWLLIDLFNRQCDYEIATLLVDGIKTQLQMDPTTPCTSFKLWSEAFEYWSGTYTEGNVITGPGYGVYDERLRYPLREVMQLANTNLSLNGTPSAIEYLGKIQNTLECFFERLPVAKIDFDRQDIVTLF